MSDTVEKWLQQRTFHHDEFSDLSELAQIKKEKNLKISLCFPTLNEEKTIGKSIVVMKSELMDRYPILDEIAVIDSGSNDDTLKIARTFGAKTFCASDYLPEQGECKGKGENLWKALYLLKGDIIIYVDSDISNIHHRFAYGLIGPILRDANIKLVKAFYARPFKSSTGLNPSGGGRVTEILVRPLFSLFFPELVGIIQPLSGEYAVYRTVLEQIEFPIGYGVETGMLIDIYQKWGLNAIAQTNLEVRIHRNQDIGPLGRMSFGILQTFYKRLQKYHEENKIICKSHIMRQISSLNDIKEESEAKLTDYDIQEKERRPMIEVEAYRKRMHSDEVANSSLPS